MVEKVCMGFMFIKKVYAAKETETGITIHYVNEKYDDGTIIFQAKCLLNKHDSIKEIEKKVHKLEKVFPKKL